MRVHSSDVTGVSVFSRQRSRGLAGKGELLRSGMGRSGVLEPVEREAGGLQSAFSFGLVGLDRPGCYYPCPGSLGVKPPICFLYMSHSD